MIDLLANQIGDRKKNMQSYAVTKIMEYVNSHYCEASLSLKLISQELGFQENYISRLFKTTCGENLSNVIEKLRIEKACELLKGSDLKIAEIAECVGYASDISFRRAFKKITGLTPGEYRGE